MMDETISYMKCEYVSGTNYVSGYVIPEIQVVVNRKGIIAWIFRLFGNWRGYEDVPMNEALKRVKVSIGRPIQGSLKIETLAGDFEVTGDIEKLQEYLKKWYGYFPVKVIFREAHEKR